MSEVVSIIFAVICECGMRCSCAPASAKTSTSGRLARITPMKLWPSAVSLARDYEAHAIETADGQSFIGVIRASLPDVLVFADAGALEHRIPHSQITAKTMLTTSLMPQGLDKALTEQQLMDLVAFLRNRK